MNQRHTKIHIYKTPQVAEPFLEFLFCLGTFWTVILAGLKQACPRMQSVTRLSSQATIMMIRPWFRHVIPDIPTLLSLSTYICMYIHIMLCSKHMAWTLVPADTSTVLQITYIERYSGTRLSASGFFQPPLITCFIPEKMFHRKDSKIFTEIQHLKIEVELAL